MDDWGPITVGSAEVRDLDTRWNRLEVHFPLSDSGPTEWRDYLSASLAHLVDAGNPQPALRSEDIVVMSLEGEANLAAWMKRIPQLVTQANDYYRNTVIPEKAAKVQTARKAEEERQGRIEEARKQIEKLANEDDDG